MTLNSCQRSTERGDKISYSLLISILRYPNHDMKGRESMEKINDREIVLTQAVFDLLMGENQMRYLEAEQVWVNESDGVRVSRDEAYTLVLWLLKDALSEGEDLGGYQEFQISPMNLPCGCCMLCGCTCSEDQIELVKAKLS